MGTSCCHAACGLIKVFKRADIGVLLAFISTFQVGSLLQKRHAMEEVGEKIARGTPQVLDCRSRDKV